MKALPLEDVAFHPKQYLPVKDLQDNNFHKVLKSSLILHLKEACQLEIYLWIRKEIYDNVSMNITYS